MIGRLGIPTSITGQSTSSAATSSASSRSSITSTSGMMGIGSSSLSGFSTGISKFSSMTKIVTETLVSSTVDGEKKAKDDRKAQIALVVQMLEDISLQSPSTHLGLVLAYTGRNSSPVIHPGLKFTWFRMQGQDHIDQVEESQRAWYAPSVDDINCTICVQCEDNFEQGLSRYLECGPLQADPLLRSASESAISSGFFETKGVCVSFGLEKSESSNTQSLVVDGSTVPVISPVDPHALHTTLSKENAFLQLNGRCTVEVDEQGIFISIPTFHAPSRISSRHGEDRATFNTSRRGLRLPISTQMTVHCAATSSLVLSVPIMQQQAPVGMESGAEEGEPLSPAFESSSTGINNDDESSSTASSPVKKTSNNDAEVAGDSKTNSSAHTEDDAMKQFLSSSILAIPWTYEGHNLSPETYISGLGSKLSPEDREKLLKEAEEDSMIFAQTVVALTEFIATVPEGTKELVLCFSCSDRLTRDILVLSMRALACKANNTSRYERRRVLPWVQWEDEDGGGNGNYEQHSSSQHIASGGAQEHRGNANAIETSDNEWKRRLKVVEEEAAALKRERNELTKQLLEAKEEMSVTKAKYNKLAKSQGNANTSLGTSLSAASSDHGNGAHTSDDGSRPVTHLSALSEGDELSQNNSSHHHQTQDSEQPKYENGDNDDVFAITDIRQLQQKLIELENKVSMMTKREHDGIRQREELETQNTKLSSELDSTRRKKDDAREKLATLQKLHDQQGILMRKLEQERDSLQDKVASVAEKDQKLHLLEEELRRCKDKVLQYEEEIGTLRSQIAKNKEVQEQQAAKLTALETEHAVKLQLLQSNITHVEQQLSSAMTENKRQEREILQHQETIIRQEEALNRVKILETQLQDAQKQNDVLQAEFNHVTKKSDSLAKDLKRIMRENAQSVSEFEKALIRKSGECDELYYQLLELKEMENARMQGASTEDSAGAAILAKISSIVSNTQAKAMGSSSTHENASSGNIDTANASAAGSGQLSSRVSTMFRRMSASAASLAANVTGSTGDDVSSSS